MIGQSQKEKIVTHKKKKKVLKIFTRELKKSEENQERVKKG